MKEAQSKRIGRRGFLRGASALAAGALVSNCRSTTGTPRALGRQTRLATFACDVTLPLGTPIYSSYKPLETIEHPLMAKGVVIEQGNDRYVLCAVDYCELRNSTYDLFREAVAESAQTSISHVAVQTVHQHTAPMGDADARPFIDAVNPPPAFPANEVWDTLAATLGGAVREAMGNFTPVDAVGMSQARVDRVASNRRVPLGDGKVGFRASSCRDEKIRDMPEGLIDPMLQTITFAQNGRPVARLHYYATHPQSFYGDPRASYDFVGMAREHLEQEEGIFQVYFTGCAGNVAAGKYNDGSPEARQGLYERLYAAMKASCAAPTFVPITPITWTTAEFPLTERDDPGYTEEDCRAQLADVSRPDSVRTGGAMGLAYRLRSNRPIELNALHMGNLHIAHLPGEPMIEYQLFAKELRAGEFVAVSGYGDCAPGYICLASGYGEGGYEPTASLLRPESEGPFRESIRQLLA
ncbi:MAG TPA: hypothetical protein PLD73_08380 [Candidatus Hydrogenedentes bacterium]|nr:hypothetical protein [Candidatus Hydrogenedentota bacterium]